MKKTWLGRHTKRPFFKICEQRERGLALLSSASPTVYRGDNVAMFIMKSNWQPCKHKLSSSTRTMALKTYGDRPISFQLENDGEYYCIGSEVRLLIFKDFDTVLIFCLFYFRLAIICASSEAPCIRSTPACSGG